MIDNANIIYTYGLSLGETDLTWRNEIIKWLSNDNNHQLIMYDYEMSYTSYKTVAERMDIAENTEFLRNFIRFVFD